MRSIGPGWTGLFWSLLVWFAAPTEAPAEGTNGSLERVAVRVAITANAYRHINRNDLEAAYRALAQTVGRRRGYDIESSTETYRSRSELETRLQDPLVRLVIMDSPEYLAWNIPGLAPLYLSAEGERVGRRYLLLTHQDGPYPRLADLRAQPLLLLELASAPLGQYWLESLLLENHLGSPPEFFGGLTGVVKPTQAVLPVFFGKAPACVVDDISWEVMSELNPQVARKLRVIASSEPLVGVVYCLRESGWPPGQLKTDFVQVLGELHLETAGRQILSLVKTERLIPFREPTLDTLRRLQARRTESIALEAKP